MRLEGEGTGLEAPFASFEIPFTSCTSELEPHEEEGMGHSLLSSSYSLGEMPRELGRTGLEADDESRELPFAPRRERPRSRSVGGWQLDAQRLLYAHRNYLSRDLLARQDAVAKGLGGFYGPQGSAVTSGVEAAVGDSWADGRVL
jgi:hypothetical protein